MEIKNVLKVLKPAAVVLSTVRKKREVLHLQGLIARGLRIGKNVYINEDVYFDYAHPYLIEVEDDCRISAGVRFLAHDATTFKDLGATRLAKVRILKGTFIGEHAIILPGVTIGPNALIAAGAVVNRDIGEDMCAAGNPAKPYGKFSKLLERHIKEINEDNLFDFADFETGKLSIDNIRALCDRLGTIYLKGIPRVDPHYINPDFDALKRDNEKACKQLWITKAKLAEALARNLELDSFSAKTSEQHI